MLPMTDPSRRSVDPGSGDPTSGDPVPGDPARRTAPGDLTALPSVAVRVFAFVCIAVAGAAGAVIGYGFIDLQCRGDCSIQTGLGALVGGILAATGTAVVAVLTLRAMGEWKTIKSVGCAPATDTPVVDATPPRQPRVR